MAIRFEHSESEDGSNVASQTGLLRKQYIFLFLGSNQPEGPIGGKAEAATAESVAIHVAVQRLALLERNDDDVLPLLRPQGRKGGRRTCWQVI